MAGTRQKLIMSCFHWKQPESTNNPPNVLDLQGNSFFFSQHGGIKTQKCKKKNLKNAMAIKDIKRSDVNPTRNQTRQKIKHKR